MPVLEWRNDSDGFAFANSWTFDRTEKRVLSGIAAAASPTALGALASDAEDAVMEATDPLTAAATMASRPSRADFIKALLAAIDENRGRNHGQLPNDFKATDNTLASFASCALDLGVKDLVDGPYVKRLRQRERDGAK